ncbi:Glycosyl hydrolases 35 family protein [Acanthocheilonema viteae]
MKRLWFVAILQCIFIYQKIFSQLVNFSNSSFAIDYQNNTFLLNGKPFRYISGSIHYFRIHPHYWADRLSRIRAAGLNAIQLYIPWNFHEVYNGRYLFNGQRNISRFIELAASNHLFVLARIGPYICAEWENGGLPWWLTHKYSDIDQRTSDKRFLQEVELWFNVLLPILNNHLLKNGGPILMVQVENEYGSHKACDGVYMKRLSDMVRYHFGSDVLQYTTDGSGERYLRCGTTSGAYPTIDFGPTSRQNVNAHFALQRRYAPHGPLVNSEFYPGWLVLWGQRSQKLPSTAEMIDTADYMYYLGANINFYMFHGGTNFGYWNGAETAAPVITSYDYSAPLTEAGDLTPKYMAIRNWLASKPDWPYKPGDVPQDNLKIGYGSVKLKKILPLGKYFWELVGESRECRRTKYPLSFEQLEHPFGFVIYHTTLKFGGTNLTIPLIKDRGYVLIDSELQGVLVNKFGSYFKHWIELKDAKEGAKLGILVENQGRQTIPTINDFKGILTNVTLNGQTIDDWIQCALHSKLLISISRRAQRWSHFNAYESGIGLYMGYFYANRLADTFFNPSGWGKGQVFINGHNIGRYWPSVGPQITLYVPKYYLRQHNTIIILELEQSENCQKQFCAISFIDHPIFNFTK